LAEQPERSTAVRSAEGIFVMGRDSWNAFILQMQKVRETGRALSSAPEARTARVLYRKEINALKPLARTESDRLIIATLECEARLEATYFVYIEGGALRPSRTKPSGSRFVFTFQAPDFDTDAELQAHFIERFFPLRVVFDDERDQEHLADDRLDYAGGRSLLSAAASITVCDVYDDTLKANRTVQVRRVRLLTKDGRMIAQRVAG
jgi:hypothetical protein